MTQYPYDLYLEICFLNIQESMYISKKHTHVTTQSQKKHVPQKNKYIKSNHQLGKNIRNIYNTWLKLLLCKNSI